jgi:Asp-tRNA(Asn)/Glu-tRNA(Gln) amidotransferase A subunit family amidase
MKQLLWPALALATMSSPAVGQRVETVPSESSITAEYYYRIKWGSHDEFKRLYERNHAPIMREMQKQGFVLRMEVEEPFTHLGGGARWDLRVTVTYRDAASAVLGSRFDKAFSDAEARLYPDKAKFTAEEARRFSLLEDHWDVIVTPVAPK